MCFPGADRFVTRPISSYYCGQDCQGRLDLRTGFWACTRCTQLGPRAPSWLRRFHTAKESFTEGSRIVRVPYIEVYTSKQIIPLPCRSLQLLYQNQTAGFSASLAATRIVCDFQHIDVHRVLLRPFSPSSWYHSHLMGKKRIEARHSCSRTTLLTHNKQHTNITRHHNRMINAGMKKLGSTRSNYHSSATLQLDQQRRSASA